MKNETHDQLQGLFKTSSIFFLIMKQGNNII